MPVVFSRRLLQYVESAPDALVYHGQKVQFAALALQGYCHRRLAVRAGGNATVGGGGGGGGGGGETSIFPGKKGNAMVLASQIYIIGRSIRYWLVTVYVTYIGVEAAYACDINWRGWGEGGCPVDKKDLMCVMMA